MLAVSDDHRILGYAQRKAALREQVASAVGEALMVFAADKISHAVRQAQVLSRMPPGHAARVNQAT